MGYKLPSGFVKRPLSLARYLFSFFLYFLMSLIPNFHLIPLQLALGGKNIFFWQVDAMVVPFLELAHRHVFGGGSFKNSNNSHGVSYHTYRTLPKQTGNLWRGFNHELKVFSKATQWHQVFFPSQNKGLFHAFGFNGVGEIINISHTQELFSFLICFKM